MVRRAGIWLLALGVLLASGCSSTPFGRSFTGTVVLIGLGTDAEGASVPAVVVSVDVARSTAEAANPRLEVTLPGTTSNRLRDAYPFAGGKGVAEALATAWERETAPHIVLDSEHLVEIIGDGGVEVELGTAIAAYSDGRLVRLASGRATYAGPELSALLASIDYIAPTDRAGVENALAEALVRAANERPGILGTLAEDDRTATDLSPAGVQECVAALENASSELDFSGYQ